MFIFFILNKMRGKKLLDYINFQKRFLNRICFNFLNRQNGCYLYWFWKETKIEEIHYILEIVTKKLMCKLRQYANVQSEITLVSWHDNLPASQFDSYILFTKHETRTRSQSSWIRIKYKLSNIGRAIIYNILQKR